MWRRSGPELAATLPQAARSVCQMGRERSDDVRRELACGKIGGLEVDEVERFLAEAHLARLACIDHLGTYVVPVWHEWSDGSFHDPAQTVGVGGVPARRAAGADDRRGRRWQVIAQCEAECSRRLLVIAERMSMRYSSARTARSTSNSPRSGTPGYSGCGPADVDVAGRRSAPATRPRLPT